MGARYIRIQTGHGPAYAKRSAGARLGRVDAAVFDCDGVLIDSRLSYDATIGVTLERLFYEILGVRLPWTLRAASLIDRLRRTGGFNNDWDTTFALAILGACSLPETYRRRVGAGAATAPRGRARLSASEIEATFSSIARMLEWFESLEDSSGKAGVERLVRRSVSGGQLALCETVSERTGYPGTPPSSLLATLFDEIYHGPELYARMYGTQARYSRSVGLIARERVLLGPSDLRRLHRMFEGRLALATGRPKLPTERTLGGLMAFFKSGASVFIGDADLPLQGGESLDRFRKPSGLALVRARRLFHSDSLLYVGDSAEDLIMARNAAKDGGEVSFVATYGTSYDAKGTVDFFKRGGAEIIVPTVRDVEGVLSEGVGA